MLLSTIGSASRVFFLIIGKTAQIDKLKRKAPNL